MVPPVRLVQAIDRVRGALLRIRRSTVPPGLAVLELATGAWTTQIVWVAAKLGVDDQLSSGPRRADDIAERVGICRSSRTSTPIRNWLRSSTTR
jgi:hypothetical protein